MLSTNFQYQHGHTECKRGKVSKKYMDAKGQNLKCIGAVAPKAP